MSKEAEILRTCTSCHDTHLCQKSSKSRGSCIPGVSVLQKVTLKNFRQILEKTFEIWGKSRGGPAAQQTISTSERGYI